MLRGLNVLLLLKTNNELSYPLNKLFFEKYLVHAGDSMGFRGESVKIARDVIRLMRSLYGSMPFPKISDPVFIVGCGRSGTTIFGSALSKHASITYLNEPREIWYAAYPETDIWTSRAASRGGKLCLTESDVGSRKSSKLSRLFYLETILTRRPFLVEKLPVNNFRLKFIRAIFPNARFVHIYRNGLEVARSIEKTCEDGAWFGADSYKWDKLVEYAQERGEIGQLTEICTTYFDKGLFEWRLSTEAVVEFLKTLPDNQYYELSYDELMDEPVEVVARVLDFIGVGRDERVDNFVSAIVSRKSGKLAKEDISEQSELIGGELLALSMDGTQGITKRVA